uniref:Argininosuccinate lyase n=1 Tax=Cereibacter sphaeroides (strain ATCC 17025 / ATH 2.4.3) TaxID=349102 RepID=A4WYP6_CERS5
MGQTGATEQGIAFDRVNKWYGQMHVLQDVTFSVATGERIVVCGPSGSGKSTMIRCINRLEEHQSGPIRVGGVEVIPADCARDLLRGVATIRAEGPGAIDLDPQFEDSYFAFENRLGQIAGRGVAGWLHVGRSRNDIGATLDRMAVRETCLALLAEMEATRRACLEAAGRHVLTVMPGYTHLQPAQPITFGYYLANVAQGMEREHERLAAVLDRADACPLGSAALAGTSFPIDRDETAALLGFARPAVPGLDAVASRDFVTELLWAVTSAQVLFSRVAQDLYTFTTWEFGALSFPDRVAGTSSIMPQKKNMLPLEYFRAEAGRSIGALAGALSAVKGSNYSIGLDSVREGVADAWPAFARFRAALPLLRLILETATPDAEKLLQRCKANFSTATDLADGLVRDFGISFRDAHHVVGRAVQRVLATGGGAEDLTVEVLNAAAEDEIGRRFDLPEERLRRWMDPVEAVRARTVPGGTAPEVVTAMLARMEARLSADASAREARTAALAEAASRLAGRVAALRD